MHSRDWLAWFWIAQIPCPPCGPATGFPTGGEHGRPVMPRLRRRPLQPRGEGDLSSTNGSFFPSLAIDPGKVTQLSTKRCACGDNRGPLSTRAHDGCHRRGHADLGRSDGYLPECCRRAADCAVTNQFPAQKKSRSSRNPPQPVHRSFPVPISWILMPPGSSPAIRGKSSTP